MKKRRIKLKIFHLFKGLTTAYYFRQLFFGGLLGVFFIYLSFQSESIQYERVLFYVLCTLLYPYSRFAYETILDFLLGNNVFIHNIVVFLIWKIITIVLCWALSIFIAPIGLLFIYFYQKKEENNEKNS